MKKYFTAKNLFIVVVALLLAKLVFATLDYGLCVLIGDPYMSPNEAENRCFRERFAL